MSDRYIVLAKQSGNSVYVEFKYKDGRPGGGSFSRPGELISFSENMVCVKYGTSITTYDADNNTIASRSA